MAMSFKPRVHAPLLAVSALLAAGCTPVDHSLGEALKYDMALQTVDPDPVYPEDGAQPGDHGEKAEGAVERYRKGEVKALDEQRTSTAGPN
jgi:hypothetical protein